MTAPSPTADGWRDIANGPRDGTEVLVGVWVDGIWASWVTNFAVGSAWPWGCDGMYGDPPTHFHALPLPPSPPPLGETGASTETDPPSVGAPVHGSGDA